MIPSAWRAAPVVAFAERGNSKMRIRHLDGGVAHTPGVPTGLGRRQRPARPRPPHFLADRRGSPFQEDDLA
jgi:hypothetical protein